jgi:glycine hydroxymethyltransferase
MLDIERAHAALQDVDPEIAALIEQEERYQLESVRLIPSENYVSQAV